jgi:galactoside O-acetyltransferase
MTNPMIPSYLTNVDSRPVTIGKHSIIGSGSIVLPGVVIGDGCAIGAMSLVKCNCEAFGAYMGIPARRRGERSKGILRKEKEFIKNNKV